MISTKLSTVNTNYFFREVNLFKNSFNNRTMNFLKKSFSRIMISTKLSMTHIDNLLVEVF